MKNTQPKLRFKEYREKLNSINLGDITEWSSGGTPSKQVESYWNGDIPWISASSMRGLFYTDSELKITNEALKKGSKLAKKGNLLILVRGSMLYNKIPVGIAGVDVAFNQDVKSIKVKHNSIAEYVLQYLVSKEPILMNMVTGTGIGAGKLDLSDLKSLKINLPTLPEQQKIASFLTAVDDKLQALKKKKAGFERYKKGVMQQIFSQKLRFKDEYGKGFPKWEKKKLGEIGITYNGISGKSKDDFGSGKPYIQYKQIFDDSRIDITRFEFVKINDDETQNKVLFGDVFFTTSSETPSEIGMSSVLLDNIDDLYLNSFCFGYRINSQNQFSPYFAQFLFRSFKFRASIMKLAQGSTRFNLSKTQLMKIEIELPSFPEQTKIANFLSAIDDKIQQVEKQISGIELWKKGLLQQLFV